MIRNELILEMMKENNQLETTFGEQSDLYLRILQNKVENLIKGIDEYNVDKINTEIINVISSGLGLLYTVIDKEYISEKFDWNLINGHWNNSPIGYEVLNDPIAAFSDGIDFVRNSYDVYLENDKCDKFQFEYFLDDLYFLMEDCFVYGLSLNVEFEEIFNNITFDKLIGE